MELPSERVVTRVILPVSDMGRGVTFYASLGFEVEQYDDGYAWVRHQGDEVLHLRVESGLDESANPTVGYFHVQDARAWHRALAATPAEIADVVDQPWGMREFTIVDPFGNVIRVGQNL